MELALNRDDCAGDNDNDDDDDDNNGGFCCGMSRLADVDHCYHDLTPRIFAENGSLLCTD